MKMKNLALVATLLTTCLAVPVGAGAEPMPMEGEMQSQPMGGMEGMNANAGMGGKMGAMGEMNEMDGMGEKGKGAMDQTGSMGSMGSMDSMGSMGSGMTSASDLVPLRQTAESLGYKVTWNDQERSVLLEAPMMNGSMSDNKKMSDGKMMMDDKKMMDDSMNSMMMGGGTVKVVIDSKTFWHGGQSGMLEMAPLIVNDMTYVSRKFVDTYLTMRMEMGMDMGKPKNDAKSMMK